MSRYHYC